MDAFPTRIPILPPLELRGIVAGSGFRWHLAGIEVWRGLTCLGTLSTDAVRHILEHHLATAALQAAILADLGPVRKPLAQAEPRGGPLPSQALRATLRARRRARGKPHGKSLS